MAILESKHRHKNNLLPADIKRVGNSATRNAHFAIIKHWALDKTILEDVSGNHKEAEEATREENAYGK